jgi:lipopolysaccharide/colanic/teichoic acid biosynthesis glycosyltransferase
VTPVGLATLEQGERTVVRARRATNPRRSTRHGSHVVSAELFKLLLLRERRRAERSNRDFTLLLLELDGGESPAIWRRVFAAIAAAKRETDIAGWFEPGAVAGVILPETVAPHDSIRRVVTDRLRAELAKSLDPEALARVSITVCVHSAATGATASEAAAALRAARRKQPGSSIRAAAKRLLDIGGSLALLMALAPVLLVIAALVKLTSPGPVFFRQQRVGENAEPFMMLKFRTMFVNCDSAAHRQYVSQFIKAGAPAGGGVFKMTHDPRITPLGRFLRKSSLDELPQFINVLRGDMSLVGPRPPLGYEVEQYKAWHCRRVLDAKPGITGLWQVTGRSRTTFDEMVRLDLRYAKSPSLWTDIKILLATPGAVVSGKGAC